MEKALRYELINVIPALTGVIYPTNAPETATKPYLVYARINTDPYKTLDGTGSDGALSYMFSIMATEYADMKVLAEQVKAFLIALPLKTIGATDNIYVEDLTLNNFSETYEFELGINRGIIDFTIYY